MTADALVVGRGLPAYLLRVAIVVVGAAIVFLSFSEGITTGTFVLLLPAVLVSAYAPASPAPAAVIVVAAVLLTLADGDPLRAGVLAVIPLVHLFHVVCGLAGVVPVSGRVHLRALRTTLVRFLLVQAGTAVVVVLVAVLPSARTSPVVEVVALVAVAGLALLALWFQRVK